MSGVKCKISFLLNVLFDAKHLVNKKINGPNINQIPKRVRYNIFPKKSDLLRINKNSNTINKQNNKRQICSDLV